jgi:DNA-binding NarL/FixJ family response regulator
MTDDVAQPCIVLTHGGARTRAALAGMLRMSGYDVVASEAAVGPDDRGAGAARDFLADDAGESAAGTAPSVGGETAGDLCLLLADDLNGGTGEVIREVRAADPQLPVIVLSAREDPESILSALDAGARGYIGADADDDALLCAIEAAMSGSTVINTRGEGSISTGLRSLGYSPGACLRSRYGLSRREHEILGLLAANRSTTQIATALYLAPKTVENYLTRIYSKLGVHSRAEAVAEGFHRGLLDPDA